MRNVILLFIGQALGVATGTMIAVSGPILGTELAPTLALTTLPITALIIGVAINATPAALVVRKIGRRKGFFLALVVASMASLLYAAAAELHSFILLIVATLVMGTTGSFVQQYRFTAAECVPAQRMSFAISFVLLGSVLGGFIGPQVINSLDHLIFQTKFVTSFVILALLQFCLAVWFLFGLKIDAPITELKVTEHEASDKRTRIRLITIVALMGGVIAYGAMNLVMTSTPVSMHVHHGHTVEQTSSVIQAHVIAMYLPSVLTGWLLARFKVKWVLPFGVMVFIISSLSGTQGVSFNHYLYTLVLLGVAWNLLFTSSTQLLVEQSNDTNRHMLQGVNDTIVFGTTALVSFSAGTLVHMFSWSTINLMALPVLMLFLVFSVIVLWRSRRRTQA